MSRLPLVDRLLAPGIPYHLLRRRAVGTWCRIGRGQCKGGRGRQTTVETSRQHGMPDCGVAGSTLQVRDSASGRYAKLTPALVGGRPFQLPKNYGRPDRDNRRSEFVR